MTSFKARKSSYTRGVGECKMRFSSTGENGRKPGLICKRVNKLSVKSETFSVNVKTSVSEYIRTYRRVISMSFWLYALKAKQN